MVVGTAEICLRMDGCQNLKDKRRILRSLLDRLRRDYQVAAAETDDLDLWNSATVGVAAVSNNARHLESILAHVRETIDRNPEVEIESVDQRIEPQD